MKFVFATVLVGSALLLADPSDKPAASVGSLDAAVESYEHLSIVLVEVRKTEDYLVKSIIAHHHQAAQAHLRTAQGGKDVLKHLEAAATEVTNMANEGDKRVLAIRQRLAKAGSTHKTDKDTKEDYLWIDSKEKKDALAAAKSIAQLGDKATADQIAAAAKSLDTLYQKAVAGE
jgi:predicted choloylglycine hydrolase